MKIDLDFNLYKKIPLETIILNLNKKTRKLFNINQEFKQVDNLLDHPPNKNEVFKMLSGKNGFSSIGLIYFVAQIK